MTGSHLSKQLLQSLMGSNDSLTLQTSYFTPHDSPNQEYEVKQIPVAPGE